MGTPSAVLVFLRAMLVAKVSLAVENLALRLQLAVYGQSVKRPKLYPRHRVFWIWLSRLWPDWRSALIIVQPQTVIRWHRQGFKLYWRWKSRRRKPGRPRYLSRCWSSCNAFFRRPTVRARVTASVVAWDVFFFVLPVILR